VRPPSPRPVLEVQNVQSTELDGALLALDCRLVQGRGTRAKRGLPPRVDPLAQLALNLRTGSLAPTFETNVGG
jgi:hypothetical protein